MELETIVVTTEVTIGVTTVVVLPITDTTVLGHVTVVISVCTKDIVKLFEGRGVAVAVALYYE